MSPSEPYPVTDLTRLTARISELEAEVESLRTLRITAEVEALRQKVADAEFKLSGTVQALEWIRDTDSPEHAPLIAADWFRTNAREASE